MTNLLLILLIAWSIGAGVVFALAVPPKPRCCEDCDTDDHCPMHCQWVA